MGVDPNGGLLQETKILSVVWPFLYNVRFPCQFRKVINDLEQNYFSQSFNLVNALDMFRHQTFQLSYSSVGEIV